MIYKTPSVFALALTASLSLGGVGAFAQDVSLASFDQQAASDAQRDVKGALTQMSRHRWSAARADLENAETALLNRESLDLGTALDATQPLPKTQAMTDIDAARSALTSHDAKQAQDQATRASQELGPETGAV